MDLIDPVPIPQLFVLSTVSTIQGEPPAHRAHLYWDADEAEAAGNRAVADKPEEVASLAYRVLPLEGPLGGASLRARAR